MLFVVLVSRPLSSLGILLTLLGCLRLPDPHRIPRCQGTIPNALQLQTALLLDNQGAGCEPKGDGKARAWWLARRKQVELLAQSTAHATRSIKT